MGITRRRNAMDAILSILGSDSIAIGLVVAVVGAIGVVRLSLRDMYASRLWRLQAHWDD
jgi:multisubunit Na+/H+ antiporter MnhG subunit